MKRDWLGLGVATACALVAMREALKGSLSEPMRPEWMVLWALAYLALRASREG